MTAAVTGDPSEGTGPPAEDAAEQAILHAPAAGLRQRTLRGMGWMGLAFAAQTVMQVAFLAVLARLVTPHEYGLVTGALLAVFLTTVLAQSGIGAAIVQRKDLTDAHLRVGYTLSVGLGVVCWLLLALLAPYVAALLRLPELASILRVVSLIFVLQSLTLSDFVLARRLEFGKLAIAETTAMAVGYGGVAIVLAAYGFGAWAIVGGQLGQATVRTVMVTCFAPHPMRPLLAKGPARDIVGYGAGQTISSVASWAATQGDNLVVGRWLGAAALGLYGRAYQMVNMVAMLFGQVSNEVLFPAMAAVQTEKDTLRRVYRTGVAALAVLVLPISMVAAVTSTQLVLLLLGPDWLPLRDAFNVIVFGMLFRTSYKLSDSLARATGAVYRRAWRTIVYATVVIGGAVIGQHWGIRGVAVAVLVALTVNYLLMAQLSLRLTGTTWSEFAGDHAPALLLSGIAGGVAALLQQSLEALGLPGLVVLAVTWAAAGVALLLTVRLAPRWDIARSLTSLIRSFSDLVRGRPAVLIGRLIGPAYRTAER